MSNRELVVLGTASQAPTRVRNHNGYLLRWEDEGLLFDPGEGTQRQMLLAGVRASEISRICITHFHGDHCLGLPGVLQRLSLDRVAHEVACYYPAEGEEYFWRLRHAAIFHDLATIRQHPVGREPAEGSTAGPGRAGQDPAGRAPAGRAPAGHDSRGQDPAGEGWVIGETAAFRLTAWRLSHRVPTIGYQLAEPDGRRMVPERLATMGIGGPDVGRLAQQGWLDVNGRRVHLAEVSEPRPGQRFAFIMDTRLCESVFALAEGADLMVCESTFLASDAALAPEYGHLTATEAGQIAAQSGVRTLVLTHFSQRYTHEDPRRFADEAASVFGGEVVVAGDLERIPVPRRR